MPFFFLYYKMLIWFKKEKKFVFEGEEGIVFCLGALARFFVLGLESLHSRV